MKSFLALILVVLAGCVSGPAGSTSSKKFEYPPPPDAPQSMNITWPQMLKVLAGGEVTYAYEARSLTVDVYTADGRRYRTHEPRFSAIREELKKFAPNLRPSDIQSE